MNLSIELHNFSLVNIHFLDTKRNIIMDGNFTKIIYSNQWFTVNSIYLHFPIEITSIDKVMNKYYLRFSPYSAKNLQIVQDLAKIESRILEYFKKFFGLNTRVSGLLSKQLNTGNMKIFKEYIEPNELANRRNWSNEPRAILQRPLGEPVGADADKLFVIKISGVWESYEEIGLTYKLLEASSS